VHIINLKKLHI